MTIRWAIFWTGFILLGFSIGELIGLYSVNAQQPEVEIRQISEDRKWEVLDKIPTHISIESEEIDVEIVPGKINNGEWEVSDGTANYLIGSGVLGDKGNVVIYAHRRPELFANLEGIEKDSVVQVSSRDVVAMYKVEEVATVSPNDVSVIEPSKLPLLTLYTCDGWQDQERLVVKARLYKQYRNGFGGLIAGTEI